MRLTNIPENERHRAPLERGLEKILTPFDRFIKSQSSTGILLLSSAALALWLANSDYSQIYQQWGQIPIRVGVGSVTIEHSIHHWVNDGLMVLFFFILGLEIKRELLAGKLRDVRQSMLVIFMAAGGMIVPALLYTLIVDATDALPGWGIPMATDTAFALGILALLGARVPGSLPVLLAALAIVDDIGAVLVISIFYTDALLYDYLIYAAIVLVVLLAFNVVGLRHPVFYLTGGLVLWAFVQHSGIHPTTAGIVTALIVPARPYVDTSWFSKKMHALLKRFEKLDNSEQSILEETRQHKVVEQIQEVALKTTTPLQHWESVLDKPVSLLVIPVFAFLNAGVTLPSDVGSLLQAPVLWAVAISLVIGKGLGISVFAWIAFRLRLASMPSDIRFAHIVGVALLAGIGFTMSLFIAALAFLGDAQLLVHAKLGILLGSVVAGIAGVAILLLARPAKAAPGTA